MTYTFQNTLQNPLFPDVLDVNPQEVLENKDHLTLIDVREVSEFNAELGHAPSASLIVLSTLSEKLNQIPKDKPIVFICRSGGRSAQATYYAKTHGFDKVYNMKGGMLLWNQLCLPTEKQ